VTAEMVQGVFFEGCQAISEEISNFGMDFLFKSAFSESTNILSRLLKKPSIDSVIAHLHVVHSVLSGMHISPQMISSIFEYIAKTIDVKGFEYAIQKEKK